MSSKPLFLLFCTLVIARPITAGETSPLRVTELKMCREMVDRECRGAGTTFPSRVESVAFFTRVEGATGDAFVEHVWKRDGKEVRRSRVPIKAGSYRAWTTRRIAGQSGRWKCEVVDPVGRSLGKIDFVVEKAAGTTRDEPDAPSGE